MTEYICEWCDEPVGNPRYHLKGKSSPNFCMELHAKAGTPDDLWDRIVKTEVENMTEKGRDALRKEEEEQHEDYVKMGQVGVQETEEFFDFPLYFVTGENVEESGFVPAYYRVEGPNGPVTYRNPSAGPYETTMVDLVMDAGVKEVEGEDTPWSDD